jgi:hypothetical protein
MKKKLETMWPPLEARVRNPNRIEPAVARFGMGKMRNLFPERGVRSTAADAVQHDPWLSKPLPGRLDPFGGAHDVWRVPAGGRRRGRVVEAWPTRKARGSRAGWPCRVRGEPLESLAMKRRSRSMRNGRSMRLLDWPRMWRVAGGGGLEELAELVLGGNPFFTDGCARPPPG